MRLKIEPYILNTLFSIILIFLIMGCKSNDSHSISLEYQNDELLNNLGVGLVQQINTEKDIELYKDKKLTTKLSYNITNIIPVFYKPDYGILYFVCLENKSDYCKILLNNSETAFIKKSLEYKFLNWNNFIKQSTGIESKNIEKHPIRKEINGKKINFKDWKEDSDIEVLEIKGNWLKIKGITNIIVYWLQWRNKNNLLVNISLLM